MFYFLKTVNIPINLMARLIKHKANRPVEIKVGHESKLICMCGLSKKPPLCDGSHNMTEYEDPNKLYKYVGDKRIEINSDTI